MARCRITLTDPPDRSLDYPSTPKRSFKQHHSFKLLDVAHFDHLDPHQNSTELQSRFLHVLQTIRFSEWNLVPDTTFRAAVVTLSIWSVHCNTVSASPSIATCQDGIFPTHLPCKAWPTIIRICQQLRLTPKHQPTKSAAQRSPLHRWLVRHLPQSRICGRPCCSIPTQCAQPRMAAHACPAIFRRQGIWHV